MYNFRVNKLHDNSIIEECTSIVVTCDTPEEAKEILEKYGYIVVSIDEEFEIIKVK